MLLDQPCKTSGERGRERREPRLLYSRVYFKRHPSLRSVPQKTQKPKPTERERGSSHHRHHRNPKNAPISMAESTQLQQAQLATILGPDLAPFETLISHLMASANEQRSQAELLFNLCKQTVPDSLSLKLAHLLQFSLAQEARAMSAILLRKQLTRDNTHL
ncbi:hypothetical protein ACLB2K_045979 [Fragaria x ananassa]